MIDDEDVRKAYGLLEHAKKDIADFESITGRKIPLRDIEPRYGEWFVAKTLIDHGFHIERIGQTGPDIVTTAGSRVEVKTSRRTKRFPRGGKVGYGWAVPKKQWQGHEFDFLVCVLADKSPPQALCFEFGEVMDGFTLASWNRPDRREAEARKLNLMDGGLKGFEANDRVARERYAYEGEPTKFEKGLNRNPESYLETYTLSRMADMIARR